MKYQIVREDPLNWAIQEYQEGGQVISRGKFAGQLTTAKWKPSEAFYPTLKYAAIALLDKAAGDAILAGEAASIMDAIKIAETRVLAALPAEVPIEVAT